jgi:hypothetical protein
LAWAGLSGQGPSLSLTSNRHGGEEAEIAWKLTPQIL